ncbi:MAG: nucleotidyltransferase domain-containing protein [Candidatus Kuenenbacteria bacterium]
MDTKKVLKKNRAKVAINDYINYLNNEFGLNVNKVYIYGSQARGNANKDSDIDVAIISKDFDNDFDALQYLWVKRRMKDVRNRIEPVGFNLKTFNPKINPLAAIIKEEGIEVKI